MDTLVWGRLCAEAERRAAGADPAHDFAHVERVLASARALAHAEGADVDVCATAALLHELFNHPKGHPESHLSGDVCAEHAAALLGQEGLEPSFAARVCEAIRTHPFSRGLAPEGLEGRVLQDADRLDAIGAIGVARCFATCASMGRPFYAPVDPFCAAGRAPDDKAWGLDHFFTKLLRIAGGLHTQAARELATPRVAFLRAFLAQLEAEVAGGAPGLRGGEAPVE